jgi:hypothetical protein
MTAQNSKMKIHLKEMSSDSSDGFRWNADIKELPGSPPVGFGATKEQAIAVLFLRLRGSNDKFYGSVLDRCTEVEIVEIPAMKAVDCPICKTSPSISGSYYNRFSWEISCDKCKLFIHSSWENTANKEENDTTNELKEMAIARWNMVCGNDEQREEARMTHAEILEKYSEEKNGNE